MYIKYRVKRTSGPVHEPIPAHPDSIYRPIPPNNSPLGASRILANSPMVAAPLVAGTGGLPLGWIIGPLIALLTAVALAGLVFAMKKKQNLDEKAQQGEDDNHPPPQKKDIFNIKSRPNRKEDFNDDDQENQEKSNVLSEQNQSTIPSSSIDPDHSTTSLIKPDGRFSLSNLSSLKTNSNPMLNSSLKQTRSMSNHRTESNLSENLQPTSIARSISLSKSNNDPLKNSSTHKLNEENNREWPLSSVHSQLTDPNISNKSHDNHQIEQHDRDQSPQLSSVSTGNRQNKEKKKPSSNLDSSSDTNKTHSSSIINQNLSNTLSRSQQNSFRPNVPLCKTSTSSDDDDYDEIYPIHSNHSYHHQYD